MKRGYIIIGLLLISFAMSSCSKKNEGQVACNAEYVFPSLNFQVINETDFTMPVYTIFDIKIYLKNSLNKTDTLNPVLRSASGQSYFSFNVKRAKEKDTCYIQIKNYIKDTLIYTISNSSAPCAQPYINQVTINKSSMLTIMPNAIVKIKK